MPPKPASSSPAPEAPRLHPRNRHRAPYDFSALQRSWPDLARFIRLNPLGRETIDFADPAAVLALNRALLAHHYGVSAWTIPPGYLCPPVPGRADYLHHLADLLGEGAAGVVPRGPTVRVIDVGVGANCIYPILGVTEYQWSFVGTEVDPVALASARAIVAGHAPLAAHVECRRQRSRDALFDGVVKPGETFAASICNPPFHVSAQAAAAGTLRKLRQLGGGAPRTPVRNFGGRGHELWCDGGEVAFVQRLITESAARPGLCGWFTSLVSKRESLPLLHRRLAAVRAAEVRTIDLAHGQKKSRLLAWRFAPARPRGAPPSRKPSP